MQITDVKIKLALGQKGPLRAFCSITFDGEFVVRDIKVISGQKGMFVAMPNCKRIIKCRSCLTGNDYGSVYCHGCGLQILSEPSESAGRPRIFTDIAHPITAECRGRIQSAVLKALEQETLRAQQPDYSCVYDLTDVA